MSAPWVADGAPMTARDEHDADVERWQDDGGRADFQLPRNARTRASIQAMVAGLS